MKVLHLNEVQATLIASDWAFSLPGDIKAHTVPTLWELIKEVEQAFGLVWREDMKRFSRPV